MHYLPKSATKLYMSMKVFFPSTLSANHGFGTGVSLLRYCNNLSMDKDSTLFAFYGEHVLGSDSLYLDRVTYRNTAGFNIINLSNKREITKGVWHTCKFHCNRSTGALKAWWDTVVVLDTSGLTLDLIPYMALYGPWHGFHPQDSAAGGNYILHDSVYLGRNDLPLCRGTFDRMVITSRYDQCDTIRCNYLYVNASESAVFRRPIFVKDSVVYATGSKIGSLAGAYIRNSSSAAITVRLNGVTATPMVRIGSKVRWK
jgi:hypothetical protein